MSILDKVYDRGVGARKTNPQSVRSVSNPSKKPGGTSLRGKMSAEQWAMARVYSFVMKQPGTWQKADKDLADKVRKKKIRGYTR